MDEQEARDCGRTGMMRGQLSALRKGCIEFSAHFSPYRRRDRPNHGYLLHAQRHPAFSCDDRQIPQPDDVRGGEGTLPSRPGVRRRRLGFILGTDAMGSARTVTLNGLRLMSSLRSEWVPARDGGRLGSGQRGTFWRPSYEPSLADVVGGRPWRAWNYLGRIR